MIIDKYLEIELKIGSLKVRIHNAKTEAPAEVESLNNELVMLQNEYARKPLEAHEWRSFDCLDLELTGDIIDGKMTYWV